MTDFERGRQKALWIGSADQATCFEIKRAGGPDYLSGKCGEETPEWHRGFDSGIAVLRGQQ